jgi:hypothetical protein
MLGYEDGADVAAMEGTGVEEHLGYSKRSAVRQRKNGFTMNSSAQSGLRESV